MPLTPRSEVARTQGKNWRRRLVLVASVALIGLFGDHIVGWMYFKFLCKDAGAYIYRVVHDVPNIRSDLANPDTVRVLAYMFAERVSYDGKIIRYVRRDNDVIVESPSSLISKYSVAWVREDLPFVDKAELVIADDENREQLGVFRRYAFRGGWLVRSVLAGFGGVAGACPSGPFSYGTFITSVLRPVTKAK